MITDQCWERVLNNYPELILNLAHFGKENKKLMLFPAEGWTRKIIKMIDRFDYLYMSSYFSLEEKQQFCTVNAERFLFGEKEAVERIEVDEEVAVAREV